MRHILLFAAVMALLTTHARVRGADFVVVNNCPKFTVVNNIPDAKKTSTCNCGITGRCQCWADECRCAACGLGGAAAGPKPTGSPITGATPARNAATHQGPEREPGSSAVMPGAASTSTSAPFALPGGGTNCPNGQCQSATTYQRRGLIFWR